MAVLTDKKGNQPYFPGVGKPIVVRVGWFAAEGVGRPFEAWRAQGEGHVPTGRAFTYSGAMRRANR